MIVDRVVYCWAFVYCSRVIIISWNRGTCSVVVVQTTLFAGKVEKCGWRHRLALESHSSVFVVENDWNERINCRQRVGPSKCQLMFLRWFVWFSLNGIVLVARPLALFLMALNIRWTEELKLSGVVVGSRCTRHSFFAIAINLNDLRQCKAHLIMKLNGNQNAH